VIDQGELLGLYPAETVLHGLLVLPAVFAALALGLGCRRVPVDTLDRRRAERLPITMAVVGGLATLAWSLLLLDLGEEPRARSRVDVVWIQSLDLHWSLGVDGISIPLILMTTLITAACLVWLLREPPDGQRAELAVLLLVVETGVLGSFLALDMVLFFVFFEVALIPMWFVIDRWGDPSDPAARRRAATRFLVFTVLGSALMLVGFLMVGSIAGTFDIIAITRSSYATSGAASMVASVLIALGLAVKTPLWPLHIWLPDAHSKAPTVGSVVLAALLLKLGTYGLVRFWLPVTDPSWALLTPALAALGVVGIVYAALACLVQTDLKRLIAYSSVGHMGFVVLAVATFTTGGVQAAVFASVAHGLITGLLFFLAGAVKDRYGTTDLSRLTVLYARVPRLAGVFAFGAMASLGLPGLAGFWGEMLAIRAAVSPAPVLPGVTFAVLAVVAGLGVVLTAAYFLALIRRMLQGSELEPNVEPGPSVEPHPGGGSHLAGAATLAEPVQTTRSDVTGVEWVVWAPLVALTVLLGVAPAVVLTPVGVAARMYVGGGG